MGKVTFSRYDTADYLKSREDIALYLEAVLEEGGDAGEIANALGVIARSQGMREIAEKTGLSRETLYRTLSAGGNPTLATLQNVLQALGLRLAVVPAEAA